MVNHALDMVCFKHGPPWLTMVNHGRPCFDHALTMLFQHPKPCFEKHGVQACPDHG